MSLADRRPVLPLAAMAVALFVQAVGTAPALAGSPKRPADAGGSLQPTIHYADARAHAQDRLDFAPGGRVSVGFEPRQGDQWHIGGTGPRALPAGRLNGRQLRELGTPVRLDPVVGRPLAGAVGDAVFSTWTRDTSAGAWASAAPASGNKLRREVFGFLPYWELSDRSTSLDFSKLSTIAYFGVGIDARGNLEKRNRDGGTTVGWSGWTSSRMTNVINAAHRKHTRVVLTVQSFGWTSTQLDRQKRFLGSATARANLARQVAAAVRDRGADGVNLDLEPLAKGYEDEFTALIRRMRTELDRVRPGYQLTFDVTGQVANYPIERATTSRGADAILIMGYDYRTAGSSPVGSVAPLSRSGYDIRETVRAFKARVPPSKLILGVPYYGRAWSTSSDKLHARNISGTKYGASTTVPYETAVDYLREYGRRYDATEGVAWTAYKRKQCTAAYGCLKPWRQLYIDDARALRAKYDLVNDAGLRGVGIWALGYDGGRTELWKAIGDAFAPDRTPPSVGIRALAATQANLVFTLRWTGNDPSGIGSYDTQVSVDGGAWKAWLSKTAATSATFLGREGSSYAFRVRARDVPGNTSTWATARTTVRPVIAKLGLGPDAASRAFSPDGDGVRDRVRISWTNARRLDALELRVIDADGAIVDVRRITGGRLAKGAHGYSWDGMKRGKRLPNCVYLVALVGRANGTTYANPSTKLIQANQLGSHGVRIDVVNPNLRIAAAPTRFSPNGDDVGDTTTVRWSSNEALNARVEILRGSTVVRAWSYSGRMAAKVRWNGRDASGAVLPDGRYTVRVRGRDAAGNPARAEIALSIDRTLRSVARTPSRFYPHDGDALKRSTRLAYRLTRSANVTLQVYRGDTLIKTVYRAKRFPPGAYAWTWKGRDAAGRFVPRGSYTLRLTATSSSGTTVRSETVLVDAFRTTLSATTRRAGQKLTVTVLPVERLRGAPRISLRQAGAAAVTKTAKRLASGEYRVSFTIAPGAPGTAKITITGTDSSGGTNRSFARLVVR